MAVEKNEKNYGKIEKKNVFFQAFKTLPFLPFISLFSRKKIFFNLNDLQNMSPKLCFLGGKDPNKRVA